MATGESLQAGTDLSIAILPKMSRTRMGSAVITLSLDPKWFLQTIEKL